MKSNKTETIPIPFKPMTRAEAMNLANQDKSYPASYQFQALREDLLRRTLGLKKEEKAARDEGMRGVSSVADWQVIYKKYYKDISEDEIGSLTFRKFCEIKRIKIKD